ncbi:NUDIX hydrolase [Amycolatopsis rhabdoformis]|uniref:NUDIX hydrolase n=1 Tax=Amycolatopsis rhabdoformis TaxID=1448059 RepID=A0ABZ1I442_9PSEU|nr:NUDIX hydrolase [Amycolatopsis rhabdoformis]WSE29045.1 NUDIX hydrolase [Amycolatopsis rhabdoformis]
MADNHDTVEMARLTGDVVAFAQRAGIWHVLLIMRRWNPFEGYWALPGGHVEPGETFREAAVREFTEEAGLLVERFGEVGVYDKPGRDPRGRYVTGAFWTVLHTLVPPTAGDDARLARWLPLAWVLRNRERIAFDHPRIITDAARCVDLPTTPGPEETR